MIPVTPRLALDEGEIVESFVRASGPGGQNVNKVSTAVELRFDAARSPSLTDPVRARLRVLAGRRMTQDGVIVIDAQRFRTPRAQPGGRAGAPRRADPGGNRRAQGAPADTPDPRLQGAPPRRQDEARPRQGAQVGAAGSRVARLWRVRVTYGSRGRARARIGAAAVTRCAVGDPNGPGSERAQVPWRPCAS